MSDTERRRNPRYATESPVTIRRKGEGVGAKMVDINEGGIGIVVEEAFLPGTRIKVKIRYVDAFLVDGTVKWASLIPEGAQSNYRIGIEADSIMLKPKGSGTASPDRSEFVKRLAENKQ